MKLSFTEDHERLRTSVRAFLEERSPVAEARRLMETDEGHDPAVWAEAATRVGLQGLAVPTGLGGRGGGLVELAVAFEEMGRTLLCGPYLSTMALAARAILASGDEAAAKELLPRIASGETVATLAVTEDSGRWDEGSVTARARPEGDRWALDGHKTFVIDGQVADLVLVAARADDAVG
ncbi:MAG TPA: acyl-CoA dehydrogenase family protein, partial [Acidimicrobiales bacterium]|nr:acyl-CoA dehydrogenase family protein [Acidimicrobiales bacterium]